MKTYTVHDDAEAKALHDGRISLLILPMEPQSTKLSAEVVRILSLASVLDDLSLGEPQWYCENADGKLVARIMADAPYAPGEIVGVKEAYWYCCEGCKTAKYRADDPDALGPDTRTIRGVLYTVANNKWYEPDSMPDWAIRTRFRVLTAEARPVGSITEEEAIAAGVDNDCWIDGKPMSAVWYNYVMGMWDGALDGPVDSFKTMWSARHPQYPFETTWTWFIGIELLKGK